jgi:hypothetical protein
MGLDNLMVNGLYITRLEGAKFEVDRTEKHPAKNYIYQCPRKNQ